MFSRILGSTAILAGLSVAAPVTAETTLHILHINDLHSRIAPINRFNSTCSAEDDAAGECFGGVARIATAVDMKRAELEGENVLVLDAGDQYQGSLFFTTYRGAAAGEFMEAIGFDAMALGNTNSTMVPKGSSRCWTRSASRSSPAISTSARNPRSKAAWATPRSSTSTACRWASCRH